MGSIKNFDDYESPIDLINALESQSSELGNIFSFSLLLLKTNPPKTILRLIAQRRNIENENIKVPDEDKVLKIYDNYIDAKSKFDDVLFELEKTNYKIFTRQL